MKIVILGIIGIIGLLIIILIVIRVLKRLLNEIEVENVKYKRNVKYVKKPFMSKCEYDFYKKISILEKQFKIVPQVNLASIIDKIGERYRNELFRNIDFAIFSNDYSRLLLLIELNDKTHNKTKRIKRDLKVKKICNDANIKLITFYTTYQNKQDYVINRILTEIKEVLDKEKIS